MFRLMLVPCLLLALDGAVGNRAGTGSPFALGMSKPVALALAGPGALTGVLCGGMDAVMVERGGASTMAGFAAGRVAEIEAEYEIRRSRMRKAIPINPLRPVKVCPEDIDDVYGVDEGNGSCAVCHK